MAYFKGTNGNDTLNGTTRADVLDLLDGRDTGYGAGGNDTLKGGNGDDTLFGGTGSDLLLGGRGDDTIFANNRGAGDEGNNRIYGQVGNDTLIGGGLGDYLDGGPGNDYISGTSQLYGREGDDQIIGSDRNDLIDGGSGNDILSSYGGTDTVLGRSGDDEIQFRGAGTISAGDGADDVSWIGSKAVGATVELGSGADTIQAIYDPINISSGYYPGGGIVMISDFVSGEDLIMPALFRVGFPDDPGSGEPGNDLGATFGNFDANSDGVLDGQDRGITVAGGDMTINLNVGLRDAAARNGVDVSIGQQMTLKLLGITELDATDFSTVV